MYLNDESHERHDHFHEHDDDHDHYDLYADTRLYSSKLCIQSVTVVTALVNMSRKNTSAPCVVVKELSWRAKRSP